MALDLRSIPKAHVRTDDGVIGTSGKETVLVALTVKGGSATTTAALYDGTSTGGVAVENIIAPIDSTVAAYYGPDGIYCGSGLYLDITTTGGSVTAVYRQSD